MTIEETTLQDIMHIGSNLRDADRLELESWGLPMDRVVHDSWKSSKTTRTVKIDGVPCLIFGVAQVFEGQGSVWALGTDEVLKIRRLFLRHSRRWVGVLMQGFDRVFNRVHVDNKLHLRWLRWIGFTLSAPVTIGEHQYIPIEKINV